MTLANHVDLAARDDPDRPAMSDPERGMRYGEPAADAVADGLASPGGDRTALREEVVA